VSAAARAPSSAPRVAVEALEGAEVPARLVRVRGRRHILVRVSPEGEVEVRTPWRCSRRTARDALRRHSDWVRDTLERARATAAAQPRLGHGTRLPLLDETLTLSMVPGPRVRVRRHGDELHVTGPGLDPAGLREALVRWYRTEAKALLSDRTRPLAAALGVAPARVAVRAQRTLWGSCSTRGTVSLNWRLVLLPATLADYVIVHELCHLRHMSHSPAFWALVAGALPDWRERRRQLATLSSALPL
jgi:hypothetical protein